VCWRSWEVGECMVGAKVGVGVLCSGGSVASAGKVRSGDVKGDVKSDVNSRRQQPGSRSGGRAG
jgi:hypothetical protein